MSKDPNKWLGVGRLTKDPVLSPVGTDMVVCNFCLAIGKKPNKKTNEHRAIFVNFTAFGKAAENMCKYLKKGDQMYVEGYLDQNTWVNREGKEVSQIKVVTEEIKYLTKNNQKQKYNDENVPTYSELMGESEVNF